MNGGCTHLDRIREASRGGYAIGDFLSRNGYPFAGQPRGMAAVAGPG